MPEALTDAIREYWDRQPCNIRHGTALVGSKAWGEQVTWRKYMVESHIPAFAQFSRWAGKQVLDVGCGIGTDALEFARHGAWVTAMDSSSASLTLAFNRAAVDPFAAHMHFYDADAEQWIPEGPYDLIYSFGVLHHMPHPERALKLMRAQLAETGELRIMLYARWSLKRVLGRQPEAQAGCPLVRYYTARSARALLSSTGFEVVSVNKRHIFPYRIRDYVQHRHVRLWPFRILPRLLFHALERAAGEHLLIVARRRGE